MNNNDIVSAEVVHGISQTSGKPFKAVDIHIQTSVGVYTKRIFPTPLEVDLIEKALNKFNSIFSEEN